jgi:hypothetical protein
MKKKNKFLFIKNIYYVRITAWYDVINNLKEVMISFKIIHHKVSILSSSLPQNPHLGKHA